MKEILRPQADYSLEVDEVIARQTVKYEKYLVVKGKANSPTLSKEKGYFILGCFIDGEYYSTARICSRMDELVVEMLNYSSLERLWEEMLLRMDKHFLMDVFYIDEIHGLPSTS